MQRVPNIARIHAQAQRVLLRSSQLRQRRQLHYLLQDLRSAHLTYSQFGQIPTFPRTSSSLLRFLSTPSVSGNDQTPSTDSKSSPSDSKPASSSSKDTPKAANPSSKNSTDAKSDKDSTKSSNAKSESSTGSGPKGGPKPNEDDSGANSSWMAQAALALFVMLGLSVLGSRDSGREISFHAFIWDLLQPGLVDRIEVVNRNVARVYLKSSANANDQNPSINRRTMSTTTGNETDTQLSDSFDSQQQSDWGSRADNSSNRVSNGDDTIRVSLHSISTGQKMSSSASSSPSDSPFYFNIGSVDTFEKKLETIQEDLGFEPDDFVPVLYTKESSIITELLRQLPSIVLLGVGILVLRNALSQFGGMSGGRSGIFQVGKANPTVVKGDSGAPSVTFSQVAGLDEAKQEVMEFVDFLKNPTRYESLGAKIPKGALLVGPPGTGKTLLAKATAGEASVPFFSMSGSDFIEMFVGVGPSRVRDLFSQARASAPCIIFIDEIDAIGKARGRGGMAGGNDERENTLNALLVEMDGFSSSTGVVVLAGTNRADVLDRALLRPGRFDRQVNIDKPDMRGRFQIFMVHLQPLKLHDEDSKIAKRLAALTPGFAGADIANICNEAALIAARGDKSAVHMVDFEQATDRVIGGLEKKNKVISKSEREIVAHHEAGHAVAGWFLKHADPLIKVSIIPRGSAALGFAQYLPADKFLQSKEQIKDFMIMALGGRVAEQICFGSITTGAQDDLKRVTRAVYAQITNFGMSEKIGKIYFPRAGENGGNQFYKPYSEHTAEMIDDEAIRILDEAYQECTELLTSKQDVLKDLAKRLLEKEVLREDDLTDIMGDRPFAKPVSYDEFVGRFEKDRENRTGKSSTKDQGDGTTRDASTTPPIPVAEQPDMKQPPPSPQGDEGEIIPELA